MNHPEIADKTLHYSHTHRVAPVCAAALGAGLLYGGLFCDMAFMRMAVSLVGGVGALIVASVLFEKVELVLDAQSGKGYLRRLRLRGSRRYEIALSDIRAVLVERSFGGEAARSSRVALDVNGKRMALTSEYYRGNVAGQLAASLQAWLVKEGVAAELKAADRRAPAEYKRDPKNGKL